jgi:hypothetical protein
MIDRIVNYVLVTERCIGELNALFDWAYYVEGFWPQAMAEFYGNPATYPLALAPLNDPEGIKEFHVKCKRLCYPPDSDWPCTWRVNMSSFLSSKFLIIWNIYKSSLILMVFVAYAGLQCTMSYDLAEHPFAEEIDLRANLQVCVVFVHLTFFLHLITAQA